MEKKHTVFLTGATGLVGSYLMKVLLEKGHKVYALSRRKNGISAKKRTEDVLKFWDEGVFQKKSKNLAVVEGDITKKDLDLGSKKNRLINEIDEVFHCAAITDFNWPLESIRNVNVGGTRRILDFALMCNKKGVLSKVNYLSTIFIYGNYAGVFSEKDSNVGQQFSNSYGQSKFESELLVEKYRNEGLWVDIFRPAIIIGESKTGKIISFNRAFYQAIHIWNLELFDYYPGKKSFVFNIVFVDDLCRCIYKITSNNFGRNRNYHPFSSEQISLEKVIDFSSNFLGFKRPTLISTKKFFNRKLTTTQKSLLEFNFLFKNSRVKLDSSNTVNLLRKNGFNFSEFNEDSFKNILANCVNRRFLKIK